MPSFKWRLVRTSQLLTSKQTLSFLNWKPIVISKSITPRAIDGPNFLSVTSIHRVGLVQSNSENGIISLIIWEFIHQRNLLSVLFMVALTSIPKRVIWTNTCLSIRKEEASNVPSVKNSSVPKLSCSFISRLTMTSRKKKKKKKMGKTWESNCLLWKQFARNRTKMRDRSHRLCLFKESIQY